MNIAIIGNSQAGGAGKILSSKLKSDGNSVMVEYKDGSGSSDLARQFKVILSNGFTPDKIYVFCGSSDASGIKNFLNISSTIPITWYGSSPATRISDIPRAKVVFTKKINDQYHWFNSGEASDREKRNDELKKILSEYSNVKYVDYRELVLNNSVVQKSGVSFPDQPDGIHISSSTAKDIFSESNFEKPTSDASSYPGSPSTAMIVLPFALIGVVAAIIRSVGRKSRNEEVKK